MLLFILLLIRCKDGSSTAPPAFPDVRVGMRRCRRNRRGTGSDEPALSAIPPQRINSWEGPPAPIANAPTAPEPGVWMPPRRWGNEDVTMHNSGISAPIAIAPTVPERGVWMPPQRWGNEDVNSGIPPTFQSPYVIFLAETLLAI